MKIQMRHAVVSLLVAAMSASLPAMSKQSVSVVNNQEKTVLSTEKEKVSYAIGLDIARSHVFELIAQDIDVAALQRAIENVFKGGPPLISEEVAQTTDTALRAMLAARSGQQEASGTAPPAVSKENIGLMLGSYMVGPSLLAIKDDIDLPVLLQALRTRFAKRTPLMDEQEMTTRMQAFVASKNAVVAGKNRDEGSAFLSKNKNEKGVVTTASGLQYMVLRQGSGSRPTPSNNVRVNYEGKLLSGQVFDSSYQRGQPAEFGLGQVIKGWSEGLSLMPVGSKYRFWIPADLAYGQQGTPGGPIGPDATLTFDVELLSILLNSPRFKESSCVLRFSVLVMSVSLQELASLKSDMRCFVLISTKKKLMVSIVGLFLFMSLGWSRWSRPTMPPDDCVLRRIRLRPLLMVRLLLSLSVRLRMKMVLRTCSMC